MPELDDDKDLDGFNSSIEFTTDTDPGLASSNPNPVIQNQPQGGSKVYGDGYVLAAVVATNNGPFTYQWRKDGSFLSGETNPSLALSALKLSDSGSYTLVVANHYGSTTSRIASLNVGQALPAITWTNPAAITYGTALSSNQLNATSTVTGRFTYTPTNGAVLHAGTNTLTAVFTATDTNNYVSPVTNTVSLVVNKASSTITGLATTDTKAFGTLPYSLVFARGASTGALSYSSTVSGVATISASGQVTIHGGGQTTLKVSQAGDSNYQAAPEVSQILTVNSLGGITSDGSSLFSSTGGGTSPASGSYSSSGAAPTLELPATMTYGQKIALPGAVQAARVGESGLNLAIPDFNPGGITRQLSLSGLNLTNYRLTVGLQIQGTGFGANLGDYCVYLRHATSTDLVGQTRVLLNRVGQTVSDPTGSMADGINAIFADAQVINVQNTSATDPNPLTGTFQPASLLAGSSNGLNTMNSPGWNENWTLFIADEGEGSTGNLVDWFLQFEDLSDSSPSANTTDGLVYEVLDTDKAVISGNELEAKSGTGQITLRARYAGGEAYTTNTITLRKTNQTITFPVLGTRSLAPAFPANASADSGLNLSFASSDTNVATVDSNGLITPVGIGTARITANQGGDGNYLPASSALQEVSIVSTPIHPYFGAVQLYSQEESNAPILGTKSGHLYDSVRYAEAPTVSGIANVTISGPATFSLFSTNQPSNGVTGYSEYVSPGMGSGFTNWAGLTNSLKNGSYNFQGKNSSYAQVTNALLTWSNSSNFPSAVPRLAGSWISQALRLADPAAAATISWGAWSNRPSTAMIRLSVEPEGYGPISGRVSTFLPADTNQFEISAGFLGTNRIYKLKLAFLDRSTEGAVQANQTEVRLATGPNYPPSAPSLANAVAGGIAVSEGTNLVGSLERPTDLDSGDSSTPTLVYVSGALSSRDNYLFEIVSNPVDSTRWDLRLRSGNFDYQRQSQYRVLVRNTDSFGLYSETALVINVERSQTISFSALTGKTYGDMAFDLGAEASSGLPVSYSSSDTSVATVDGSKVTILKAGFTTITATQAGGVDGWLAATPVEQLLRIGKATPTITAAPTASAITYGQTLASSTLSGGTADTTGSFAFTAASTKPNAGTGSQGVTFTPTDTTNYTTATTTVSVTVNAASLPTVTFIPPADLVYSRTPKTYTASATGPSSLTLGYAGRKGTTYSSTNAPTNVGDYTVTATTGDTNYSGSQALDFSITPKPLVITAEAKTKNYNDPDPALTYGESGLISPDTVTGALSRQSGENAGSYLIQQGTLSAGNNYTISFTGAQFTIWPLSLPTVTFTPPTSLEYDRQAKAYSASASGVSGFTYLYTGWGGTTYSNSVPPTRVGNYTVRATSSDPNYSGFDVQSFTITRKSLTVSGASVTSRAYNGTTNVVVSGGSLAGVETGDTVNLGGSPEGTVATAVAGNGKAVTVTGYAIGGTDSVNYLLIQPSGLTVDISRATLTVTGLSGVNKVYDGNRTAQVSGLISLVGRVGSEGPSDVDLTGTPSYQFDDPNVGTNKTITMSGGSLSGPKATNYLLSYPTSLKANITAASLPAVTFQPPASFTYDRSTKSYTATASGVGGFTYLYIGRSGTTYSNSLAPSQVGLYTVKATSADSNYQGEAVQDFTITAKGLTISGASATSRAYNGTTNVVVSGGSLVGVESGDTSNVTLGGTPSGTVASAEVGTNKVVTVTGYTISGTAGGNYSLTQPTDVTVDITKATQTISFNLTDSVLSNIGTLRLAATSDSGLTVSFESSSTLVATVSGGTLTIVGPGLVTITAKQAGNGNYEPAPNVSRQLQVVDADLPIAGADNVTAAPITNNVVKYAMAQILLNDKPSADPADTRSLSISGVSSTSVRGGAVNKKGSWIVYQPNAAAILAGSDSFTYTLSNGIKTATGAVSINLSSMPDFTLRISIESMVDRVGGGKTLTFAVSPNKTFEVQANSDLANPGGWAGVTNSSIGKAEWTSFSDGRLVVDDPRAGSVRFYRVRWIP